MNFIPSLRHYRTVSRPHFRLSCSSARLATLALAGICLVGCAPKQNVPPVPEPVPEPVVATPAIAPDELAALLDAAETAFANGQYSFPETGSAEAIYRQILSVQPDEPNAIRGLERIVEHYVNEALEAADRMQLASARSMLARARLVDPAHPAIEPTTEQIRLLSEADRVRVTLDKAALDARSADVGASLKSMGGRARETACRTEITARNDAEGRWIYQQLNQAPGDGRIRAAIQIGSPPRVELFCFAS